LRLTWGQLFRNFNLFANQPVSFSLTDGGEGLGWGTNARKPGLTFAYIDAFSGKRNGSRGHASKAVKAHRVLREPGSESDPRETDAERGTVCSLEQLLFQGGSAAVALLEDHLCGVVSEDQGEGSAKYRQEEHQ